MNPCQCLRTNVWYLLEFLTVVYNINMNTSASFRFYVGIDEVGRGPIAGPVTLGAVLVPVDIVERFRLIKESKQLSAKQRELWVEKILLAESFGVYARTHSVSASMIDRIGINRAIAYALKCALKKIPVGGSDCRVLLDGGLHAPKSYENQETIIHGDQKEVVIAMASVVAKVTRDRYMTSIGVRRYPKFGFSQHKGYGTRAHYDAIRQFGITPLHRKSFMTRIQYDASANLKNAIE